MRSFLHGSLLALMALVLTCPLLYAEEAASKEPADKPDPYAVPEGSTKELADFLVSLTKVKPANAEEVKKMRAALIQAADKILAANPEARELTLAVSAKAHALDNNPDKLAEFAAELKKGGHEGLSHKVRAFFLVRKLQLVRPTPNTAKERATEIVNFLVEEPLEAGVDVALSLVAGQIAEISGDERFTVETYGKLQKILTDSKIPVAEQVAKAMKSTLRRLTLVGNSMTIEGAVLGGGQFDWAKYQGKVVLVNFFATSCGPCRREIENIKKCYDLYHDKGFEVVGLSCDGDPAAIEKFVGDQKLPWPVVYGDKKPSPTVAYYGISGVPQLILVGKDGKVITLHARGDVLLKQLQRLLGPAEEKKAPAPAALRGAVRKA